MRAHGNATGRPWRRGHRRCRRQYRCQLRTVSSRTPAATTDSAASIARTNCARVTCSPASRGARRWVFARVREFCIISIAFHRQCDGSTLDAAETGPKVPDLDHRDDNGSPTCVHRSGTCTSKPSSTAGTAERPPDDHGAVETRLRPPSVQFKTHVTVPIKDARETRECSARARLPHTGSSARPRRVSTPQRGVSQIGRSSCCRLDICVTLIAFRQ